MSPSEKPKEPTESEQSLTENLIDRTQCLIDTIASHYRDSSYSGGKKLVNVLFQALDDVRCVINHSVHKERFVYTQWNTKESVACFQMALETTIKDVWTTSTISHCRNGTNSKANRVHSVFCDSKGSAANQSIVIRDARDQSEP